MNAKQYFDILGIPPTRDENTIRKAYHKMALKYHPDRNKSEGATHKFIEVNEAYEKLTEGLKKVDNPPSVQPQKSSTVTHRKWTHEERWKAAKSYYERQKEREEEETNIYYKAITTGKKWQIFKSILWTSIGLIFLFTLDTFWLPLTTQQVFITKKNNKLIYQNVGGVSVSPILLSNNKMIYLPMDIIDAEKHSPLYIQTTYLFKNTRDIGFWKGTKWEKYVSDFSLISLLPLAILFLLIPTVTYFIKGKTAIFNFFYHISIYLIPFIIFGILIVNFRWLHLFTLGYF